MRASTNWPRALCASGSTMDVVMNDAIRFALGPPSDSYLRSGITLSAWQRSSWWMRRNEPSLAKARSYRLTTMARCEPNSTIRVTEATNPSCLAAARQRCSLMSWLANSPGEGLTIRLVARAPVGRPHRPSISNRAIFGWAPARLQRPLAPQAIHSD